MPKKSLADTATSAFAALSKVPADGWRTVIECRQNDLWPTNSAWRFGKSDEEARRIVNCLPENHVRLRIMREKGTNTRLASIQQISQAAWDVLIAAAVNGGASPKKEPVFSRDIPENDDFVTLEEVGGKTKIRTTKSADGLEQHFDTALAGKSAPVWQDVWVKAIVRKRDKNWPGKTEVFIAENIEEADYIVCCIPDKHIQRTVIRSKNRETVRADVTSISKAALAALKKWKNPIIPPKKPRKIEPFCQYENRTAEELEIGAMVNNAAPITEKNFWRITGEIAGVTAQKKYANHTHERNGPLHDYIKRVRGGEFKDTSFELLLSYSRQYHIWNRIIHESFENTDIGRGDDGRSDFWDAVPLLGPKAFVEFLEVRREDNFEAFKEKWRGILSKGLYDVVFYGENYIEDNLNTALESFLSGDTRRAKISNLDKQKKKNASFCWEKWRKEIRKCF